ncbi:MAG: heme peroxidase, partial [Afipia sp.]|nr:heme peroxidase [Afipia sp.]
RSLAALNLRRGVQKKLASGQAIAKAMGIVALTPQEIATGPDGAVAKANGFDKATPLWYYILKEAQVKSGGLHLGPVGATIVAEVFIGIVQGSKTSYLAAPNGFKPTLGKVSGQFTIVDLLTFAGVTNLMPA